MSISSSIEATYMEILQHNSLNTDCIRREFRPHAPSPVTASGEVQASRLNSPRRSRRSWPCVVLLLTNSPMTFGENIRQWRLEKKIGLRRFAKAAGVSPTFISKMERGIGPLPGEETICRMAKFFGRDPDVLLAMADKVASDVLAVIIRQPAFAEFIR